MADNRHKQSLTELAQRFAVPVIAFLAGTGLQLSGIQNLALAVVLWGFGFIWALVALATWPGLRTWVRRLPDVRVMYKPTVESRPHRERARAHRVESGGLLWQHEGGFYIGTGDPITHALCPEHEVELVFRENDTGRERSPHDDDRVGSQNSYPWGHLICPHGSELRAWESGDTFGHAQQRAEKLMKKELAAHE